MSATPNVDELLTCQFTESSKLAFTGIKLAALTDLLGASTRPTDIPPLLHAGNYELDASAQAGAPITSDRLTFFRWSGWA